MKDVSCIGVLVKLAVAASDDPDRGVMFRHALCKGRQLYIAVLVKLSVAAADDPSRTSCSTTLFVKDVNCILLCWSNFQWLKLVIQIGASCSTTLIVKDVNCILLCWSNFQWLQLMIQVGRHVPPHSL